MRNWIQQFLALSRLTALEAARQPVTLLLTMIMTGFIAVMPMLISFKFGEAGRLVRDSALAVHLTGGLLLAAFVASSSLHRELEEGTASAVLSKPVGRGVFFCAKVCGVFLVMLQFSICLSVATLLASHAALNNNHLEWSSLLTLLAALPVAMIVAAVENYFTSRPFLSRAFSFLVGSCLLALLIVTVRNGFSGHAPIPWRIMTASLLLFFGLLLICGVTLALATRLGSLPTLAIAACIFGLGMISDYLFGARLDESYVAKVCYALLPGIQRFWMADALAADGVIPLKYALSVGVYMIFYLTSVLSLGMLSFRTVEVG